MTDGPTTPVVVLLAEAQLAGDLDERTRRRLGERARARMRRAVERHGGACVELPPGSVLALWTAGDAADPIRAVRAAEELRESVAPLGEFVALRAAFDVASSGELLAGTALAAVTALRAEAGPGDVLAGDAARRRIAAGALFDADAPRLLVDGARPAPPPPDPMPAYAEAPALSFTDGEPPPADLPDAPDERIVALFNARGWDALRGLFAPDAEQIDHRPTHAEAGEAREDLISALRSTAAEAPDARATIQRRAVDGSVTLGVLRISGHRGGRPFEHAHALLTLSGVEGIEFTEHFALGDRVAARARFDVLRGVPPEEIAPAPAPAVVEEAAPAPAVVEEVAPAPEPARDRAADRARHEAQLARWCAWFNAHDIDGLVEHGLAAGFVQVDHRGAARGAERDREGFRAATASSLEMIPDLAAEAELLSVDGDLRLARLVYAGQDVRMTTYAVGRLDGERLARQDLYEDAAQALGALRATTAAG